MSVTSYAIQWGAESTGDKHTFNYIRAAGYHLASTIDGGSTAWVDIPDADASSINMATSKLHISFRTEDGWKRTNTCALAGIDIKTGGCKLWSTAADKLVMMRSGYLTAEINLIMKNADKDKIHLLLTKRHAFGGDSTILVDDDLYIKGASCLAQTNQVWDVGHLAAGVQEKKSFNFNIQGVGNSEGYLELESNDLNGSTMTLGGEKKGPILEFEQRDVDDKLSPENCKVPTANNMCTRAPKKGGQIIVSGEADASLSEPGSFSSTLKATLTCD